MNKIENDLWSNMNNPNNSANYDNWANSHNPNNSNYMYTEDDSNETHHTYSSSYFTNNKIIKYDHNPESKKYPEVVKLIKEAITNTAGTEEYIFISQISSYLSNLDKPIYPRDVDERGWSLFINKYSDEFETFFLENNQSNMAVKLKTNKEEYNVFNRLFRTNRR